ncbi:MAG: YihY/virulence factor BrkB family protein [Desulfobacterales bacterium]|nr:YihY/virulence factor BrkB family protein [Desulfobacterales bacterium]
MNKEIKNRTDRIGQFFRHEVWHDPPDAGRIHQVLLHTLRVILITVNNFRNETIMLRSSALSYSTLLAVVPLLAIGFSMLKGLGFQTQIEHMLVSYLTAEQEQLTSKILEYISNTDFKALGALGTAVLIYAVIMMLSNVERAFNDIWGVRRSRPLVRKISDYISVLLLGPLLIVLSTAMITSMSSYTVVQNLSEYTLFRDFFFLFNTVIPHLGLWIAFTAMYIMMPNTRVRFVPALIAGVVCGSVWELAFHVYTEFNIGMARYNTIYGTFAALPIFIIWIYISWVIVLVGAQISNAIQQIRAYQQEFAGAGASFGQQQVMGLYIMHEIARRFYLGKAAPTTEQIALRLSIPSRMVERISDIFCQNGLLREIESTVRIYQPAMDLFRISAADIFGAIRDHGQTTWQIPAHAKNPRLQDLIETHQAEAARSLEQLTLGEIVSRGNHTSASHQDS